MRVLALFTVAACSAPVAQPHVAALPAPRAVPAPDAAPLPPATPPHVDRPCDDTPCDGTCVDTKAGRTCLAACTSDRDCRSDQDYTCDLAWQACAVPNSTAMVLHQCPLHGAAHDVAFEAPSEEPLGIGRDPSAVLAPNGNVVVLDETTTGIGGASGALVTGGQAPRLAHGRSFIAVWRDAEAIELAVSSDGATWAKPTAIPDAADAPPLVTIGPDPKRRGEMIYVLNGARGQGMRVRASANGSVSFGAPVTALTGTYGNAIVGSDGRLHVVALDGDALGGWGSAMHSIQYTVSSDAGASFAKPIVVSGRDDLLPFYFANPSIVVDDRRKLVYVAYLRGGRDAAWEVVIATTKDAGKTWTRRSLGDGCAWQAVPNLALDALTGTLHVAYYDTAGGPGRFVHATCASGGATCTAWGSINTRPFEPLATGPHAATAPGDYASLVIDDKRRVLHAVWAQPVREDDRVVMRVLHASAKLKR